MSDEETKKWAAKIPDLGAEWAKEMTAKGYPGWKMGQKWMAGSEKQGHKWLRQWAVKK
jgi:hypothetical protein